MVRPPLLKSVGNRGVRALTFRNTKEIGAGNEGTVYIGKIFLENARKPKRVAIKVPNKPITEEQAKKYWEIILELQKAGVRVPKIGFVKVNSNGWVLVSELYIQKGKSRLKQSYGRDWHISRKEVREETIVELTKVANAGYYPHEHTVDYLESGSIRGTHTRPIDLGQIFEKGKVPLRERAEKILQNIWMMTDDIPERTRLLILARKTATREVANAILEELKQSHVRRLLRSSSKRRSD